MPALTRSADIARLHIILGGECLNLLACGPTYPGTVTIAESADHVAILRGLARPDYDLLHGLGFVLQQGDSAGCYHVVRLPRWGVIVDRKGKAHRATEADADREQDARTCGNMSEDGDHVGRFGGVVRLLGA